MVGLASFGPRRASRDAVRPRGEKDHEEGEQADEIVVVEVRRPVDELDVSEQDKERGDGEPVAVAQCDTEAGEAEQGEMEMHPPCGPGLHPAEAVVAEVVRGLDVEVRYPTVGGEADDGDQADESEDDAERGRRSGGAGSAPARMTRPASPKTPASTRSRPAGAPVRAGVSV